MYKIHSLKKDDRNLKLLDLNVKIKRHSNSWQAEKNRHWVKNVCNSLNRTHSNILKQIYLPYENEKFICIKVRLYDVQSKLDKKEPIRVNAMLRSKRL